MDSLSIILPTYNEAANIIPLIRAIANVCQKLKRKFEILVVDDSSPDGTAEQVRSYARDQQDDVRVIVRTKNHGLGNSIKDGVLHAKGTIIIGMDADFNHDPNTIGPLLAALRHARLAVASRFVSGGGMAEKYRQWPTLMMNTLFHILGMPIRDNTSGYYAIRTADLRALGLDAIYYGYGDYHLRLVAFAAKQGYSISEVPTVYGMRRGGVSKSKLFQMARAYLKEVLRLRTLHTSP